MSFTRNGVYDASHGTPWYGNKREREVAHLSKKDLTGRLWSTWAASICVGVTTAEFAAKKQPHLRAGHFK